MDEQELQRAIQAAMQDFNNLGGVSKTTADSLGKLNKASQLIDGVFKTLIGSVKAYTKEMYNGNQGAAAFNSSLDASTEGFKQLLKLIPFVGDSLADLAGSATEAVKELNLLSDRLYTTYQALSRFGVAASDGMAGVAESAQKLGYGLDQVGLENFTKLMMDASRGLAALGGSTVEGRKRFLEIANIIRSEAGRELRNLGMNVPEINETTADFVKMQTRIGAAQARSNRSLTESAVEFARELDILAKLTGEQKDSLRKQMDAALNEQRFRAKVEELRERGEFGTIENLQKLQSAVATASPQLAEGFRDIVAAGGAVTTDAARRAFMATRGEIQSIAKDALAGKDFIGLYNRLAESTGRAQKSFRTLAKYADLSDVVGDYAKNQDLANRYIDKEGNLRDRLNGEIIKQQQGADGAVDAQTRLRQSQENSRDSLQSFVRMGVNPATRALQKLAGVPETAYGMLPGETGGNAPIGGGGASATAGSRSPPALTGGAATPTTDEYLAKLMQLESGGRNIATQLGGGTSSAFGHYQITKSTFDALVANAPPNSPLRGKTFEDMKADTELQKQAAIALTNSNAALLSRRGLSTSDAAKYMTHVLGYGTAARVLEANANMDIAKLVDERSRQNNPKIFEGIRTAGDLRKRFSDITGGGGYRFGGIASGPDSGYMATLHGKEAVVPLPDGRTIPVSITNAVPAFGAAMSEVLESMTRDSTQSGTDLKTSIDGLRQDLRSMLSGQQVANGGNVGDLMEQLVALQRRSVSAQEKLLQVQAN